MILHTTPSTYIISHPDSFIYTDKATTPTSYQLNPALFAIHKPFITNIHKNLSQTSLKVQDIYTSEVRPFYDSISAKTTPTTDTGSELDNNSAVEIAREFFTNTDYTYEKFHGANATDNLVITEFNGKEYLFPPRCRFFNCDLFGYDFDPAEKYDLVVLDPPWTNKFIKRRKGSCMGYDTHSEEQIEQLKIKSILTPGAVVAIWSTNSKTEKILNKVLQKWELSYVTTFYWLKVTTSGVPTCPFTKEGGKQPFESLILAVNGDYKTDNELITSTKQLIVSTPSAINSHKPSLTKVLEHYFQRTFSSKCELFARYLSQDYTSYGNQVLKLNNFILFNRNS